MEAGSPKRPTLGALIPILTGLVALTGAVAYAIMRYSYQQFYDRFGLTPDDVGPSSAAALTQSGIRVATFVALFALLPLVLGLLVSRALATRLESDFARSIGSMRREPRFLTRLRVVADLLLPIVPALVIYRLFTLVTSGSRELNEQIVLAIAVLLLTGKRYAERLRRDKVDLRFLGAIRRLPRTSWIVGTTLGVCGALVLGGSLPRDAKRTAGCVIDHKLPVRWVHTHRTFFGIPSLSHTAVLQVRADPAQISLSSKFSPQNLPRRNGGPTRFIYLGDAGARDFVFDLRQRRTLQIPDSSIVVMTKPARHCHWWDYRQG
jgi:hypothetical protein